MSEIDIQNAKSIRDPMDIIVRLASNSASDFSVTYYSYAPKVADYTTIAESYPMRKLADLQYEGFPLDGSCELYDSTKAASYSAGKIGIRGRAYATSSSSSRLGLKVTGTDIITNLTIEVENCEKITLSGVDYDATGGTVLIPVNARTATLYLYAAEDYKRVEVSNILTGANLTFTNEDIISCQLNLRSDLKPIDPTLPESEIEVKVYAPTDISEQVALIPEDEPLYYQAGYGSDLSAQREFYITGEVTWADSVMTVKGVDAVHFLDIEAPPIFIGSAYARFISQTYGGYEEQWHGSYDAHAVLWAAFIRYIETVAGVTLTSIESKSTLAKSSIDAEKTASVIERGNVRDIIANMMNLCHQEYESGYFSGGSNFWLTYVDAGRPRVLAKKPSSSWVIKEEDCASVTKHIGKTISKIEVRNKRLDISLFRGWAGPFVGKKAKVNQKVGSVEIFKNKGGGYTYDCLASVLQLAIPRNDSTATNPSYIITWAAPSTDGRVLPIGLSSHNVTIGVQLRDATSNGWQDWNTRWSGVGYSYDLSDVWNDLISAEYSGISKGSFTAELQGGAYNLTEEPKTYTSSVNGAVETPSKTSWVGKLCAGKYNSSSNVKTILPDEGIKSLMNRSQVTGSFTWKGDPRMQPRDVFTFHRLDGTTEDCTIESISLKHEKGGTVAEITYRKGIV